MTMESHENYQDGHHENDNERETGEPNFEAYFTRHGVALYREHERILQSENPESPIDPKGVLTPDLDPERLEDVHTKAEELLDTLDPQEDEVFIVSSNIPRAIETANIYREVAHERGFSVTNHGEKARDGYANSIGEEEIRILNNLKVDVENLVTLSVFHSDVEDQGINWEHVSAETKSKWDEARAIINADDKGNWGENFVTHADEISKLYPDIGRAKESYEMQFKNLLTLARFGAKHARSPESGKKIKVLAFGHENYIRPFLDEYFNDPELNNIETIKLEVDDDSLTAERRGERKEIPN